jgi:hypothetical protein
LILVVLMRETFMLSLGSETKRMVFIGLLLQFMGLHKWNTRNPSLGWSKHVQRKQVLLLWMESWRF